MIDTCRSFKHWLVVLLALLTAACGGGGGVEAQAAADTSSAPPARQRLLVAKTGQGSISSDVAGIACGATCSAEFDSTASVTLTAAPDAGYRFGGWSGDCSGTGTCVLTLAAARTVSATFTPQGAPTLTLAMQGQGAVISSPAGIDCGTRCSVAFAAATSVTLTPTAAAGQRFAGWSGACSGTGACVVTMNAAQGVGAVFAPQAAGRFQARPYLFKADEARLRASMAANDPEASGLASNIPGQSLGFLTLARAA